MANPQKENGYIQIANEIAEVLCKTQLSGYQNRLLWAIWRKTYGWNKKEDWVANSQLIELTGLKKGHVSRAKKELIERNILVTKTGNKIQFNKDYSQWWQLPKLVTTKKVTKIRTELPKSEPKLPKLGDTKETIQKTLIQKTITPIVPFEKFWELYPNKKSKKVAFTLWCRLSNNDKELCLTALPDHIKSDQWIRDGGRFIPHPSTWLNQRRWEDDIKSDERDERIVIS